MERKSILLVDDDTLFRKSMKKILDYEGYSVTEAQSGIEGLSTFNPDKHTIIISDYKMDDLNGIEMLRSIKKQHPKTNAILITAYHDEEIVRKAKMAGFCKILNKPLDFETFSVVVKETIMRDQLSINGN